MKALLSALAVAGPLLLPLATARADEVSDTLESALKAYNAGDVTGAQQDLEYASKLLSVMRSEALAKFLPPTPAGWTRENQDGDGSEDSSGVLGIFGGGITSSATFSKGNEDMTITLIANSPMMSGIAGMMSNFMSMGGGKPLRIQRVEFATNDGTLQGAVGDKVIVSVEGSASDADKTALVEFDGPEGAGRLLTPPDRRGLGRNARTPATGMACLPSWRPPWSFEAQARRCARASALFRL